MLFPVTHSLQDDSVVFSLVSVDTTNTLQQCVTYITFY